MFRAGVLFHVNNASAMLIYSFSEKADKHNCVSYYLRSASLAVVHSFKVIGNVTVLGVMCHELLQGRTYIGLSPLIWVGIVNILVSNGTKIIILANFVAYEDIRKLSKYAMLCQDRM